MTLKIALQKSELGWDDLIITCEGQQSVIRIESVSRGNVRLQINGSQGIKYKRMPIATKAQSENQT